MASNDTGAETAVGDESGTRTGLDAIGIDAIVLGLVQDLNDLRSGAITVPQARARAVLAHEILRGINLVVVGQRMIEGRAKALPQPDEVTPPRRSKNGKKRN